MSGTMCTGCGISNATSWGQHDTGCTVAKALREAMPTFNHTRYDGPSDPCPLCEAAMSAEALEALHKDRASCARAYGYYFRHGLQIGEALKAPGVEAAAEGGNVAVAASGPGVLLPASPERPIVRHGDVAAQLTNELTSLFRHYGALLVFEKKVAEAAQSPAAWLALREEVRK